MKRYLIWVSIVIAAILSGIIIYAALKDDEEVVLVSAVKVMTGWDSCVSVVGEISATAYYGDMYLDNREKKELLISLAKDIGIREEFEFGASWENGRDMVYLCKKGASSEFKLSMNTIETAAATAVSASAVAGHTEKTYAQYIVCRLNITDSPESVCHYAELITDEIEKRGLYCDLTLTFISSYDGEFGSEERNVLTDDILKSLGAKVVAENRSEELFSVYAHTAAAAADMAEGIVIGNDKINVNIAINYNEAKGQTRVYLATPIIKMEY